MDETTTKETFTEDIGLGTNDVVAIKNALIKAFVDGKMNADEISDAATQFIAAFTDLENQAILRDTVSSSLTDPKK